MAEQDRYGSHFGADKATAAKEHARQALRDHDLPQGSGAEQDRFGGWFGGKTSSDHHLRDKLPNASGAEQDRYGNYFGGKVPETHLRDRLPNVSAAEQDRYEHWFGGKTPYVAERAKAFARDLSKTSGAEQDRYGSHFGSASLPSASEVANKVADKVSDKIPRASGAEQDRLGSHLGRYPTNPINATAVGLLQSAVLPSFGFHSGLSAVAYAVARYTDRAEVKDYLWASGMTANAWWSALGTRVFSDGLTLSQAWSTITYPQRLLLTGVTAWGLRLLYRVASRGVKRGTDDPRYVAAKNKDPAGFWNKAALGLFLPEAVAQTLISLPFTLPFRASLESVASSPDVSYPSIFTSLAVFLFSTGFALEVLADSQLEAHKQKNSTDLNREGVWSIVRHPNYLGDALIHMSFPLLLLGAGAMHPLAVLGPIANYVFLRYVGGDRENEESQAERYTKESPAKAQQFAQYKREKNSFWPDVTELQNQWAWVVVAVGAGGVVLEQGVKAWMRG
ncbi:hypothetical protein Micbo1qcDRAFT_223886 [Microdochium bolleyi]|uniref:DUF1295 domain protein n=1 Tax=Microdochium bolleyi TaxID=196109 RepID=A0A136J3M6_9PEZI|nr:hypothetical protein Micbo1qcDRAFT_223886 [Microdochium bolleyi]